MCSFKRSEVEGELYPPEERHDMAEPPHSKLNCTIDEYNFYRVKSNKNFSYGRKLNATVIAICMDTAILMTCSVLNIHPAIWLDPIVITWF